MRIRSAFAAAALLLLPAAAPAQITDISDNELRTGLLELNRKIASARIAASELERGIDNLQRDIVLLNDLLDEVSTLADRAAIGTERRQGALSEMLEKINGLIDALSSDNTDTVTQLDQLAVGYDGRIYRNALRYYTRDHDVGKARETLESVLAFGSLSRYESAAKHWLGRIDYETGNYEEARERLTALIREHPNAPREAETLLLLAEMTALRGDREAVVWRERLLAHHPSSPAADQLRNGARR